MSFALERLLYSRSVLIGLSRLRPRRVLLASYRRTRPRDMTIIPARTACGFRIDMNLRLWDQDNPQEGQYWLGTHEPAIQRALCRLLSPGMVLYDIGSYFGYFSLIGARRVGKGGHVYAFEPDASNRDRLRSNVSMNNMEEIVSIVPAPVAEVRREVRFVEEERGDWSRIVPASSRGSSSVGMTAMSIDHFVFEEGALPPNLLKIDVEGSEVLVVRGADRTLYEHRPRLLIEVHSEEADDQLMELLSLAGYRLFRLSRPPEQQETYPHHLIAEWVGREIEGSGV